MSLGRHPNGLGDYSVYEYRDYIRVERKSLEDFQGTILGFGNGDRRERFEKELENLAEVPASIVIVEASRQMAFMSPVKHSTKPPAAVAKILMRSVIAYEQDYLVPWAFCDSRRLAEIYCFRFLERFVKKIRK